MQQVAAAAWSPASDRKIYVVWIGVVWAAILTGFGLDFVRYLGETPPPPFILHVHAAVFVLWLGLVTLQILWVEMGNLRRHKQLGWLTVAVSVLVVPLGLTAALVDQARQIAHPDYAPQFLALEFEEMIAFSIFMTAGVMFRRNPAAHKRLMILSAVAISDAGFARIWLMGIKTRDSGPVWLVAAILLGHLSHSRRHGSLGSVAPETHSSGGAVRRSPPLGGRDHHDRSQLLADMARTDGSAGQCLGLSRLNGDITAVACTLRNTGRGRVGRRGRASWKAGRRVARIRDFFFARYAIADAEHHSL